LHGVASTTCADALITCHIWAPLDP
jgi:hypothetical protein